MQSLEIQLPEIVMRRLTALAHANGNSIEAIAIECLSAFAESTKTRRAIRKSLRGESLTDLGWLDGYSGQEVDEILAFADTEDPYIIGYTLEQAIQEKLRIHGHGKRTGVELTILGVMAIQREVNNGGFDQFFRNSSRMYAPSIVGCLLRIGSEEGARIARKAIAAIGLPKQWDVNDLEAAMQSPSQERDDVFQECDEAFWSIGNLSELLVKYAREHEAAILGQ